MHISTVKFCFVLLVLTGILSFENSFIALASAQANTPVGVKTINSNGRLIKVNTRRRIADANSSKVANFSSRQRPHHQKEQNGLIGNFMQMILQVLIQLLNMVFSSFGLPAIPAIPTTGGNVVPTEANLVPTEADLVPTVPLPSTYIPQTSQAPQTPSATPANNVILPGVSPFVCGGSTNNVCTSGAPTPPATGTGEKYLIVTDPSFSTALQQFVDYRKSKGFDVVVATTATTGKTTDSIKQYVQTQYDNTATRPRYLLLVGNASLIPAWAPGGMGSDTEYARMAGNDVFPDLSVGRWPASTAQHVANMTKKTIAMDSWTCGSQKEALFMASEDQNQLTEPGQDKAVAMYQPHGFTTNKRYARLGATTDQVIADLNRGQLFLWFQGHGYQEGWPDGPALESTNLGSLTNTVYPIVYAGACETCTFPTSAVDFCEAWLQATGGAVAYMGSSMSTPWEEDIELELQMIQAIYNKGVTRVGPMLDEGKKGMYDLYQGSEASKQYYDYTNLMGDPAMKVPACP